VGLVFFVLFSMVSVGYSACEGDLNCSGTVEGSDLAIFAADFGTSGCGTCDDVIGQIDELENRIAQLEALLLRVTREGDDITFEAVNVHIVSGSEFTDGLINGLGNLIVGYISFKWLQMSG
jgi:thiol-disulfide isomerase/thioredoxin